MTLLILFGMLALGVSFLCSLLEASLLSLPRSHVESLAEGGTHSGLILKSLQQNIDRPLAAILTLNTVAHTVGAAGVGAQAAVLFGDAAVGIASGIMTLAILVFSEIIPKTLGVVHTIRLAGFTASITRGMIFLCYPVIIALEWVNRMVGYQRRKDRVSRMEILSTLRLGSEVGSLDQREYRIASNLMALSNIRLKEILTPRTVMFALPAEYTVKQALTEHHPIRYSRIPIYQENPDNMVGYVSRFDIQKAAAEGSDESPMSAFKRTIVAIPELATVGDALEQMLETSEHIALAVDEFGGVEGMVTLEDLLETLLGQEIIDETDLVADMRALAQRRAHRRGV